MFVFVHFLIDLCGRLFQKLSMAGTSVLNCFVALAVFQMTYISDLSIYARKRTEGRAYMFVFDRFLSIFTGDYLEN